MLFRWGCFFESAGAKAQAQRAGNKNSRPAVFAFLTFSGKKPRIYGDRIDFACKIEYTNKTRNMRSDFCTFIKNQTDSYE